MAWRTAGRQLLHHWTAWLIVLVAVAAIATVPSLHLTPALSANATLGAAVKTLAGAILLLAAELAAGTFLTSGLLGSLKEAADGERSSPSLARFIQLGWDQWSWLWRGVGFVLVLAAGFLAAQSALMLVASGLWGVGGSAGVLGDALVVAFFGGTLVVLLPMVFWSYVAGFYLRPHGYWPVFGRVWRALRQRPGRILGPVLSVATVAVVIEVPALVSTSGSALTGTLVPAMTTGPWFIVAMVIVEGFGMWVELTIMILTREWLSHIT